MACRPGPMHVPVFQESSSLPAAPVCPRFPPSPGVSVPLLSLLPSIRTLTQSVSQSFPSFLSRSPSLPHSLPLSLCPSALAPLTQPSFCPSVPKYRRPSIPPFLRLSLPQSVRRSLCSSAIHPREILSAPASLHPSVRHWSDWTSVRPSI